MNISLVLYVVVTLAYGEIMYGRWRRDFAGAMIEKVNARIDKEFMEREKNDTDQKN